MPPRKRRAAAGTPPQGTPQGTSLRLSAPAERLRAALKLRETLLAKVAKRKASISSIETEAEEASARVAGVMEPRWAKIRGFDDEIHQLLDALTAEPTRLPRERAILTRLYHSMQKAGVISRHADWLARTGKGEADDEHDEPRGHGGGRESAGGRNGRRGRAEPLRDFVESPDEAEVASARRPPESQHGGLRALFRRLVDAFHPDKVQDEREKTARTEVMKDITEAYRRGDLARLLELERRRAREASGAAAEDEEDLAAADVDELERRITALDQSCDELRAQLAELERAVRSVRRSPHAAMARELKRASRAGYDLVDLDVVRDLDRAARDMRKMRDALTAFREERITLIDLLSTPALEGLHEDEDLLDTVTELARQMLERQRAARDPHAHEPGSREPSSHAGHGHHGPRDRGARPGAPHAHRDPRAAATGAQSSSDDRRRRR